MAIEFISAQALFTLLNDPKTILVDVRPAHEHRHENIQANHLSLDDYRQSLAVNQSVKANQSQLNSSQQPYVVLYCSAAIRSVEIAKELAQQYPNQLFYILKDGINAWKKEALPLTKSKSFYLPISQQVQIAIGLILLIINLLAYLFGSAWFVLTAIMGVGLFLAGVTGFCGLAIVISKMPWNR
jgi:rhodanese-related sulfurtransferase